MIISEEARRFADNHRVAHLATANREGIPHVIPLCYALIGDCIYFVVDEKPKRTHLGLKRLQNIRANPQVALVIDDYADDWTQLAYLLVHGLAAILDDPAEFERALQHLRARYPQYIGMSLGFEHNPMVRITIERMQLWRANESSG
jgi:PPOX class probable F420-dependent enzyme